MKNRVYALLPLAVFLIFYLFVSIFLNDFYSIPVTVAFLFSALIAIFMNKNRKLEEKIETFCEGIANKDVALMILIFILAGGFSKIAKGIGAIDSTVNLGLSILPSNLLLLGVFIISCFISISIGSSMGTIAALAPMAVDISQKTSLGMALCIGCVVSGAMFGDNLSMISDTTIAATKTQGCDLKDKFFVNIKIILPAAIVAGGIYIILGLNGSYTTSAYDYNLLKTIPYIFVLITAIIGLNVIIVLFGGILISILIGFITGNYSILAMLAYLNEGILGMSEIIIISILIAGMVNIIKYNGGIDFILDFISSKIKSKKQAEFGIAILVGLVNICTANNTIAIVMSGPLAKDISNKFNLNSKKVASILDTFSCFFQGIIPYGAQILMASSIANISPIESMKFLYYPYLMGICAIVSIIFDYPKFKNKDINKIAS